MPFLAIASAGAQVAKFAGVSFKTPSEKRAAKVIPGVVSAANAGTMAAVAILDTRRNIGIAKERAEWAKGFAQVSASVLAAYTPNRAKWVDSIPSSAQAGPEAAASYATNAVVGLPAFDQVAAPINEAGAASTAAYQEALAQTAERVGVGGGAAAARALRGDAGPLDKLIAITQKPGGAMLLVGGAVTLVILVAFVAGRRH